MLVPSGAWSVEQTWADASAMRGSGSHTITVAEAFVPEALAHSWERPLRIHRPLYRLRFTSVTGTAAAAIAGLPPEVRDHDPRRALDGGAWAAMSPAGVTGMAGGTWAGGSGGAAAGGASPGEGPWKPAGGTNNVSGCGA